MADALAHVSLRLGSDMYYSYEVQVRKDRGVSLVRIKDVYVVIFGNKSHQNP